MLLHVTLGVKQGKEKVMEIETFVTLNLRTERSFLQNKCQEVVNKGN